MPRIPIVGALRTSPFDKLLEHARKIKECVAVLKDCITTYCEGNYEESEKLSEKVMALEHEADLIKGNITAHLPKTILLPVDTGVFLRLLSEQDSILDFAEDTVVWLHFRKTKVPKEIKDDLLNHLYKVIECIESFEKVIIHVKEIVSFASSEKLRDKIKETIKEVHLKEWEDDQIGNAFAKKTFNLSIDPLSIYHLLKLGNLIGQIAKHAEHAADRVRDMIAR
ncbi:MAG: TIGR00153 family protein [Candidatus Ratteibacteria bacterium]|nr:TIGR00153 family protein [Candidatus Ratteibacteria bacterium]